MIGLHNATSYQRLMEFSRAAFTFNVKYLVLTKVGGTAAQSGVPDLSKIAFKSGKSFIVLPDLKDAIDLLKPDYVYLVSSSAGEELSVEGIDADKNVLIVFPGIESGFTKIEQSLGKVVKLPGLEADPGPVASLGALMYCVVSKNLMEKNKSSQ
ncbi:MAG: RecB-family nuclease [Candidatus Aramenus sp.]|jgi:SpoU rRNA methylase family enzyme|nr:RecB-family nuclease [Candidatus Aramenus sp.]